MDKSIIISLCSYFIMMIGIGIYAMKKSTANNCEYLLGGRKVSPKVTALSAGASDMSGWMLMGLPGAAFVGGLDSIWIAIGLLIGAAVNYQVVAPRLRAYTEIASNSLTIPEFLSRRFDLENSSIRIVASFIIILLFTLYTSSGLVAGGKLFQSSFGLDYSIGVWLTVSVVIAYTVMGGFLAVSLTDFIQGCIMFIALICVPVFTLFELTPGTNIITPLLIDFKEVISSKTSWDMIGIISLMSWGLGYFGQPHIIVRFMAIDSVKSIPTARNIGMGWMLFTIIGSVLTGILGFYYTKQIGLELSDPETIFIYLSTTLFPPLITGWLLAAILAAVMSTISSQLLVSSSSLVEDVYKVFVNKNADTKQLLTISRGCVLIVALLATFIALDSDQKILSMVASAWAGFGASFGPVILFVLLWDKVTNKGAIIGMLTGAFTVVFWTQAPVLSDGNSLSSVFYELAPAFILNCIAIYLVSKFDKEPKQIVLDTFNQVKYVIKDSKNS